MDRTSQGMSSRNPTGNFGSRAYPATRDQQLPVSFLFVANELIIGVPDRDLYYNHVPPQDHSQYIGEIPSRVLRFKNGAVTPAADNYRWCRSGGAHTPGHLWYNGIPWPQDTANRWAVEYKTWSVFACNPLLPVMVVPVDPSLPAASGNSPDFRLLQLFHPTAPPHLVGVSQAVTDESPMGPGGGPVRYAAGRYPSWIPALVPPSFANPYPHPDRPSRGLGGELPIVLGLMALSERRGADGVNCTDHVFLGGQARWRGGHWRHHDPPTGHPASAQEDPRGFVVTVYLDPENPTISTAERLRSFEWDEVIVRESQR